MTKPSRSNITRAIVLIAAASTFVHSFDPPTPLTAATTRAKFVSSVGSAAAAAALVGTVRPVEAAARGRATLEQSYDRYGERIRKGAAFYGSDLKKIIAAADWRALKAVTSDPPPKTKADRVKPDGGAAERAALAGPISDAKVLVAADLWAGAFSDNSISAKTKAMRDQIEIIRKDINGLNRAALEGLGEAKPEGGVFGIGAKARSKNELLKDCQQFYLEGGAAFNQFFNESNDGLPVTLAKFNYLR